MLNRVQLIGHVGTEVEVRFTPQGTKVADLRLATSRFWRDGEGNRQEETEWHRVVLWAKSAENAASVLAKGRLVYVEGRLQTRSWEDESGKHFRTEIVADNWLALGRVAESGEAVA
jgi:single-strand DNA-binding protein